MAVLTRYRLPPGHHRVYRSARFVSPLGDVVSPGTVRRNAVAAYVRAHLKAGETIESIEADLRRPSGLERLHPCAGPDGRNACSESEVKSGIADALQPAPPPAPSPAKAGQVARGIRVADLLLATGVLIGWWFFFGRKK